MNSYGVDNISKIQTKTIKNSELYGLETSQRQIYTWPVKDIRGRRAIVMASADVMARSNVISRASGPTQVSRDNQVVAYTMSRHIKKKVCK